jgi:hypothetical protein
MTHHQPITHFELDTDRFGVVGDIHGRIGLLAPIFEAFQQHGIRDVFQLGDFGLPDRKPDHDDLMTTYLKDLAARHDINLRALRGNHEHGRLLRERQDAEGWVRTAPHVAVAPRIAVATSPSARIAIVGGAGSVDRNWRYPGVNFFEDEVLSQDELDALVADAANSIDLVLAHDAPGAHGGTELSRRLALTSGRWLIDDLAYAQYANLIWTRAIAAIAHPESMTSISGHMHFRHDAVETIHGKRIRTVVLDRADGGLPNSYAIVDVSDPRRPEIEWIGEG